MKGFYFIDRVKDIVKKNAPQQDKRTDIEPFLFLTHFILQFKGDVKKLTLESIRLSICAAVGISIARSSFWERIGTKRIRKMLNATLSDITNLFSDRCGVNQALMQELCVSSILLFDSTIVTLGKNAKEAFDGTFAASAIKFHLQMDGMSGAIKWALLSPASIHDSCAFADIKSLIGKLSLFDLGYYDWSRFKLMDDNGAFFLSRLKNKSSVKIAEIISGFGKQYVGKKLSEVTIRNCRGKIVEFITLRKIEGEEVRFRVIGFWNKDQKKYHWYVTNLSCDSALIAPLYRLRWQIELLIKAAKQSLNLDEIPSENDKIIINICLARLIALALAMLIRKIGLLNAQTDKHDAISVLRATKVLAQLSSNLINYIVEGAIEVTSATLKKQINVLLPELFDPNANKRTTTVGRINRIAESLA